MEPPILSLDAAAGGGGDSRSKIIQDNVLDDPRYRQWDGSFAKGATMPGNSGLE
jgi:hypothetical protein